MIKVTVSLKFWCETFHTSKRCFQKRERLKSGQAAQKYKINSIRRPKLKRLSHKIEMGYTGYDRPSDSYETISLFLNGVPFWNVLEIIQSSLKPLHRVFNIPPEYNQSVLKTICEIQYLLFVTLSEPRNFAEDCSTLWHPWGCQLSLTLTNVLESCLCNHYKMVALLT
jgi:hypothetical protein